MDGKLVHIARSGKEIGTYNYAQVPALLERGELLLTDYYWWQGMSEWKLLKSSNFNRRALPFPRPFIQVGSSALVMLWELLDSDSESCIVPQESIKYLEKRLGVNFLRTYPDELKKWYKITAIDCLRNPSLVQPGRNRLSNLAVTLGFSREVLDNLNKEIFQDYLKEYVQDLLASTLPAREKVKSINQFKDNLAATWINSGSIQKKIIESCLVGMAEQRIQEYGAIEFLSPDFSIPLHDLAKALGCSLDSNGGDSSRRIARAEATWHWYFGSLPVLKNQLNLDGENCCYIADVNLLQMKRVVIRREYSGYSYSSKSFLGIRYRAGSFDVQRAYSKQLTPIDDGKVYLTGSRLFFRGQCKNFDLKYKDILEITEYNDGLQIERKKGSNIFLICKNGSHPVMLFTILYRLINRANNS